MNTSKVDASKTHVGFSDSRPPCKWVGGKGQLLPELHRLKPSSFHAYYEPFVGGGALFFSLASAGFFRARVDPRATLSDTNEDLIQFYRTLREFPEKLINTMKQYVYEEETYYAVRAYDPKQLTDVERASRFLYLNKTCFNGLYRVNKAGKFNVPFGRYTNPTICDEDNLIACSKALRGVSIECEDFERMTACAVAPGSLVYFDPPYVPLSKTSDFTGYTKDGFNDKEHVRLARVFAQLADRGVYAMLSNSDTPFTRELYKDFDITEVMAKRHVNSKADKRGAVKEIIVRSWVKP